MEYYLISGHYSGKIQNSNFPQTFANSYNNIVLQGVISEQTELSIMFVITEIMHLDTEYENEYKSIVVGDTLKIDWLEKNEIDKEHIYYNVLDISNKTDVFNSNVSLLCSEQMYMNILYKNKYEGLIQILDKIDICDFGEKKFVINLLSESIRQIQKNI
jgi:hypothetical protein